MSDQPMPLTEGEEPLVGMLRPDLSTYSDDELRQFVIDLRTIRSSPQSRAARIEHRMKKVKAEERAEDKANKESMFDGMMD